jgi:hypothetical protein
MKKYPTLKRSVYGILGSSAFFYIFFGYAAPEIFAQKTEETNHSGAPANVENLVISPLNAGRDHSKTTGGQSFENSDSLLPASTGVYPDLQTISDFSWDLIISRARTGESHSVAVKGLAVSSVQLGRLSSLPDLKELVLDGGTTDESALTVIVENCPNLEHLRIRISPISDESTDQLVRLKKLAILNLPHSRFTAKGLKSLESLENLRQLRLGGKQLDDEAVDVLSQFPALRSLHLIRPNLTDQALNHLIKAPKLTSFYLDGCDLSDEAWQDLSHKMPGLHIHLNQPHLD